MDHSISEWYFEGFPFIRVNLSQRKVGRNMTEILNVTIHKIFSVFSLPEISPAEYKVLMDIQARKSALKAEIEQIRFEIECVTNDMAKLESANTSRGKNCSLVQPLLPSFKSRSDISVY